MSDVFIGIYRDKNGDRCEMWRNEFGDYCAIEECGTHVLLGASIPKEYTKEDMRRFM